MAVQWGPTSGHMQVGIDVYTDAYDTNTPTINVYVAFYVRTIAWGANDDQTLQPYVNGGAWGGAIGYHINSPSGATTEMHVGTITIPSQTQSYGGGPGYTFQGNVSGSALGANPSHAIGYSLPARPPNVPTQPGISVGPIGATTATVNVSAADGRGAGVDQYQVQVIRNADSAIIWESYGGSVAVTGLVRNTAYWARAMAHNAVGWGAYAISGVFTTLSLPPNAPTALAAGLPGPSTVDLTWAAPVDNGGQAIAGYYVQAATDAGFTTGLVTATLGNVLATTLGGLVPGLHYYVRVRARNSMGDGPYSNVVQIDTLSRNRVKVPGVGWVPVRVWVKVPGLGWRVVKWWKKVPGTGWTQ